MCVYRGVNLLEDERHSSHSISHLTALLSPHNCVSLAPIQFLKLTGLFLSHFSFKLEGNYNV